MGETNVRNYELSQLQAEVEEEREFKDMLQDSVSDLRSTLADLEKRLHSVDGEENEWRTRYETQQELNEQLETQITVVRERLETLHSDPADRLASIRSYDEMSEDALRQRLKLLSTEKSDLQSQLMDFKMRNVQEGKTYQKVYEERRAYHTEIAKSFESSLTGEERGGGWLWQVCGAGLNLNDKAANARHGGERERERKSSSCRPTSQPPLRDNKGGAGLTSRLLSAQLNI
ncbi:unnamed protein product [Leuciscus chuanchicus]